jgi:hypothetical protein
MNIRYPLLFALLLPLGWSCAALSGKASPWMMEKLKVHAAFDMQCSEAQLTTIETGTWSYGVRGCDKQAIYLMQSCNQMTHACTFLRNGEIRKIEGEAGDRASKQN